MPALLLCLLHDGDVEREGLEQQCPPYFYACCMTVTWKEKD